MRTVVYQSFRTKDVPQFISRCMETVRLWSRIKGYEYRFIDDGMFGYAPDWYREKTAGNICLISDLARLELAKEFHGNGVERTIWIDADVVVFNPEKFAVDTSDGHAFCKEVWVDRRNNRMGLVRPRVSNRVNNSVMVFCRGSSFLDRYIHDCKSIVRNGSKLAGCEVGTLYLTGLHKETPMKLIQNVGLFSPLVMKDIVDGKGRFLRAFARAFETPVYAANLCNSFMGKEFKNIYMHERIYDIVTEKLIESVGGIVNRNIKHKYLPLNVMGLLGIIKNRTT